MYKTSRREDKYTVCGELACGPVSMPLLSRRWMGIDFAAVSRVDALTLNRYFHYPHLSLPLFSVAHCTPFPVGSLGRQLHFLQSCQLPEGLAGPAGFCMFLFLIGNSWAFPVHFFLPFLSWRGGLAGLPLLLFCFQWAEVPCISIWRGTA